jgi:hypothetical protein
MYSYLIRCLISLITQCRAILDGMYFIIRRQAEQQESEMADLRGREIQDGVDLVRQKLDEQRNREMADLRASEYFAPPMYGDQR